MRGSIAFITFDTGHVRTLFFVAFKAIRILIKDWAIALVFPLFPPTVPCVLQNALPAHWSITAKGGEYIVEDRREIPAENTVRTHLSSLSDFVPSYWLFVHFFFSV